MRDSQHVIQLLIDVARAAYYALDDTCDDGNGLHWDEQSHDALSNALDKLDELPDDRPGYVMGPAAKAEWALRDLLSPPTAPRAQPAFPERDPSKPAEQQGMFRKFIVRRADGSDAPGGKHYGCRYFVLDLDHDQHAPAAMRAYAAACKSTHPLLSAEIEAEFGEQPAA